MKNKIIILLMFALVVVLATVAWQSLSGSDELISHNSMVENTQQPDDGKAEEKEKIIKNTTPKQQSESTLGTLMSSTEAQTEVEPSEEQSTELKLCDLVETYDDWQKSSTGYTSQKLLDEVRGWGDTRGYFEMEYNGSRMEIKKTSDYDYYETEDLRQMADAGDTIANVKMAYRLFLQGDEASVEEAQPYCERAIVDGYSAMNGCVQSYVAGLISHHGNQEEPLQERIRELQVELAAWQEMYQLRNDPLGGMLGFDRVYGIDESDITEEEISKRAHTLYQELEQKRINLGLGPFVETAAPEIFIYAVKNEVNDDDIAKCFESLSL